MSLEELTDLANYLLGKLQNKDFHFVTSIAKCSLLSLRRDVSIMDEAYTEYLPRVLTICTPEKHIIKVEDLTMELPRLLKCGETIVLPKLMMLKENVKTHMVEALLVAALLNSEVQLHYLSKNVGEDIEEGTSIAIKPEWGKTLLEAAIKSVKNREVNIKTISCTICPIRNACPFNYLGDEVVLPSDTAKIVEEIQNSLLVQGTNQATTQQVSDKGELIPPTQVTRESLRDYLRRVADWARSVKRTWVTIAVGRCPVCGREGTLVVRITRGGEKVLYRHGSSTCTIGTIDESVDKLNISKFLGIRQ